MRSWVTATFRHLIRDATTFGRNWLGLADDAAGRDALSLGTAATADSDAFDPAGAAGAAASAAESAANSYTDAVTAGLVATAVGEANSYTDSAVSSLLSADDIGTLAALNGIVSDATLIDTTDERLSDARTPTAHAASHTDGTDDIQSATSGQAGLMTAAYAAKLDGIEAAATADMAGSEILAALLPVDGDGTGLDADLLDGLQASAFALTGHTHSGTYQPLATYLTQFAALSPGMAMRVPYFPGGSPNNLSLLSLTSAGRELLATNPVTDEAIYYTSGLPTIYTLRETARSLGAANSAAEVATTLGLGTTDSPQFAGLNIGHASDTTISRVSAGQIAVAGNTVLTTASENSGKILGFSRVAAGDTTTATTAADLSVVQSISFTLAAAATVIVTMAADASHSTLGGVLTIFVHDGTTAFQLQAVNAPVMNYLLNMAGQYSLSLGAGSHTLKMRFATNQGTATYARRSFTVSIQ